ncbi:MAG: long-chain fatty acid--CoA ligase [Deltaproteobacteria bacterium]|nr:long-chain fatty acid--CoA ligase [Deltaproteobacteria bacterium]MBW2069804.1 long-chain fatty acid--CoA ligase [Deltaproteobacteria bacterium]
MANKQTWLQMYDKGVPHTIELPERTLFDYLQESAEEFPEITATDFFRARLTYRELAAQVDSFAASLHQLGVGQGDRVAIMLPNCPQTIIAYYATLSIGAVAVMTNPMYVEREMEHQFSDAGAKILVSLDHLYPRIEHVLDNTPIEHLVITSIRDYLPFPLNLLYPLKAKKQGLHMKVPFTDKIRPFKSLLQPPSQRPPRPQISMEDLAALQYTGGTTGVAKGVMLTHRNLSANVLQVAAWLPSLQRGQERFLCVLPFFHVFGMTVAMNFAIYSAASMTLVPRFEINDFLKTLVRAKPTIAPLVPTIFTSLVNHSDISKYNLSSIKYCISGSAPLPVEIMNRFEELTGSVILEGYGLTEASPVTHVNPIEGKRKSGSIGIALPSTDARIVDLEMGSKEMPPNEPGELLVKGPQVMKGYWNMPEETAATLKDGWLYTGDIAYMDEEGYVFIIDRKKDMIIAGGFNIYPRDIDEVLYEHPKIADAVAIGVPDPYRGETVKVFVVVKEGETLTAEEVISHCRERLAAYKVPRLVEFRDELPKTIVGKVLRKELRAEELRRHEEEKARA